MGKYFGTDGARGRANDKLTLDMAVKIGKYIGYYFGRKKHAKIVIGKDTRLSSDMFEMAISAGAVSTGANVYLVDVCPTPCISYLIQKEKFDCGVMISASHNPYYDNGIKLFNSQGKKMDADIEALIEQYIDDEIDITYADGENIGKVIDFSDGLVLYESRLKSVLATDLSGMSIALDLANGSATSCAVNIFTDLGVSSKVLHSQPNGININYHCGSTHPEDLQELMREGNYDVGFAFDGDADRLIAVNEDGELFDGDHILYVCSKYLRDRGLLKDNMVVTTVMANLGLYKALEKEAIDYKQTAVGDKYVFEEMEANDYILGGEQSGHIIFKRHAITGDGLLSALMLLEIMKSERKSLKQLSEELFIYPQLLINVPVKNKEKALHDDELLKLVDEVAVELASEGRILVRPSGTEPLIRVMVEAKTDALCERHVNHVVEFIKSKGL
ncbi:phosphoglucosamine mutase [Breznakia sp. PF5-3]|uniref:phosphoglucosamine mutase n=1 Tax=unclassified Breznakia TaxID=2623764 RepID=UPI00240707E4|nr:MULTISPECIES: phosphoglucosamine mutase [unclassified Breznakia]MDF9825442.1 phosphoglucosamine mutase [Breznakia sp. PM6-1]MDF9836320.1 phosphoglucosamine mutase [Breznakia sp. PF5-3]MDF9838551.1 phosphoglucosamine mutase [Breznakia sp. PFB2-8]MDF9860565.1 phosphoglucosamine mutase [Breznakia sp. PH5-24]